MISDMASEPINYTLPFPYMKENMRLGEGEETCPSHQDQNPSLCPLLIWPSPLTMQDTAAPSRRCQPQRGLLTHFCQATWLFSAWRTGADKHQNQERSCVLGTITTQAVFFPSLEPLRCEPSAQLSLNLLRSHFSPQYILFKGLLH
jgi:hypothetical protein